MMCVSDQPTTSAAVLTPAFFLAGASYIAAPQASTAHACRPRPGPRLVVATCLCQEPYRFRVSCLAVNRLQFANCLLGSLPACRRRWATCSAMCSRAATLVSRRFVQLPARQACCTDPRSHVRCLAACCTEPHGQGCVCLRLLPAAGAESRASCRDPGWPTVPPLQPYHAVNLAAHIDRLTPVATSTAPLQSSCGARPAAPC
jgi:hypothetical protein